MTDIPKVPSGFKSWEDPNLQHFLAGMYTSIFISNGTFRGYSDDTLYLSSVRAAQTHIKTYGRPSIEDSLADTEYMRTLMDAEDTSRLNSDAFIEFLRKLS